MNKSTISIYIAIYIIVFGGCQSENISKSSSSTLFENISSKHSGIKFKNQISEDVDFHHLNWESVYNGGGVATADFDNDGLLDIYFTGNQVDDAIYKNLGNLEMKDLSKKSGITKHKGWSTGVSVADVNGDGWLDIYVCRMWHAKDGQNGEKSKNLLFINNKDFTFTEQAEKYGLDDAGHGTQASFFDYDRDGDLDMYLLNAPSNNYAQKLIYIQENKLPYVHSDKLFRNDNGHFTDVNKEAGIVDHGFGLGITTVDLNHDGWTDIYVANDFQIADRLYINQKDGTFKDLIQRKLKHISFSSMGTDAADINNDGFVDIAVLDMQSADHYRSKTNMPSMDEKQFWTNVSRGQHYQYMSNMLQLNNGYGFYSEIAQIAGIASTDWSWSILMADFDLDTRKDIFITNGINKDIRNNDFTERMKKFRGKGPKALFKFSQEVGSQKISNLVYRNNEHSLHFDEISKEWGLDEKGFSYGSSYADLDNDGDLDLVINNNNALASIYRNTSTDSKTKHFINLVVTKNNLPLENVQWFVHVDGKTLFSEQARSRGFQSSLSPIAHFGLGENPRIDSISCLLPDGTKHSITSYQIDSKNSFDMSQLKQGINYHYTYPEKTLLKEITGTIKLPFRHSENKYNDFKKESLLPHMQSKNGPYMAITDDKDPIIYITNGHNSPGKLFRYQERKNKFKEINGPWSSNRSKEEQGAVFFDIDNDGDQDLYVVSGGSEFPTGDAQYQDHLYINQQGKWSESNSLPQNRFNGSLVTASDYDHDGDVDLFVGAMGVPGKYPYPSYCQLLVNENGILKDKTTELAKELKNIGMVHDAIWTDFNDDQLLDLIVVGEFMSPHFFENNGNQLEDKTTSYIDEGLSGWWFTIVEADLDHDGTPEYLLGNIGQNNKYHPDKNHPLKIYGNDFDKNSTNDIVLSKTTDKYGEVPVRGRQCSSEQMPFIKNKFNDFEGFAMADMKDIFGDRSLVESLQLSATEFSSGYLKKINNRYQFVPFPDQAQISPIRSIETTDINHDGKLDLICVGNLFDTEVETTRHDSSIGLVLIQDDNGGFKASNVLESGFYTPGNTRKIVKISRTKSPLFLVSNNNYLVQIIEQN